MTEFELQEEWKKIYTHAAYLPCVEWHRSWSSVEVSVKNGLEKANWCCENIEGYFSIRRENNFKPFRIFSFNKEEDAVAFKLRWM